MKKYYLLLALFVGLLSCSQEEIIKNDTGETSIQKPTLKKGGDGLYDLLGYAYDITGPLLENDNASDVPIIDVKKFANENPGKIDDPTSSKGEKTFYYGASSYDYLKDITTKMSFTGGITGLGIGKNIFTATITANKDYQTKYSYSSKYSFATCDSWVQIKRIRFVQDVSVSTLIKYLTPEFTENVKSMSADALVSRYGTHVLLDISIGGRMNFTYSSTIEGSTSYEKKTKAVKGGITAALSKIGLNFSTDMSKEEITSTSSENKQQQLVLRYRGGQNSGTSQTFDLNGGSITTINDGEWVKSVTPTNAALTNIEKAYPIYDFITDATKKAQVKDAVDRYITSKQIEMMDISPLYQYWSGIANDHFYTLEKTDTQGGSWKYEYPVCYIFKKQTTGTIPLYQYWSGIANDHFYSTEYRTDQSQWKYEYPVGYVYKTQVAGTVPLYQYWNGSVNDHFYSTEYRTDQSQWKYEYIVCYVYPLN